MTWRKPSMAVLAVLALHAVPTVAVSASTSTNPIAKVLEMISGLQAKIIKEGNEAQKVYNEFAEYCSDRSQEVRFEIKTAKAQQQDLSAVIEQAASKTEEFDTKIESLSSAIATDDADLKAAAAIRAKELADFSAVSKELTDVIDTIGRAISILEREASSGASFAQMQGASGVLQALQTLQQAASMDTESVSKLTAFVQSSTASADGDDETG